MRPLCSSIARIGLAASIATWLVSACASKPGPELINISGLIPIHDTRMPTVRAYEAPAFDRTRYHGLLIEPTSVYHGGDADFGGVSEADREKIAALLTSEFTRVLREKFNVVSEPGPGIVRIVLTLVGIHQSSPVLSTALRLTPVGLVVSGAKTVEGGAAPFTGNINVAGVAYDGESGQVLVAVQAVVSPTALDVTSGLTPLRAAEISSTRAAEAFRDYLIRLRAGEPH